MNTMMKRSFAFYNDFATALTRLGPLALLLFRAWVALAFWRAGVVKIEDPYGTQYLFNNEYHVPLLSGDVAAFLGTWIELITPWLLVVGLAGRLTALFLFVYNIIAVISYPDLWPHGFWTGLIGDGFNDHKVWAMMLLAVIAWGPGSLSLDALLGRLRLRYAG
jgi:putative oxidoreductase